MTREKRAKIRKYLEGIIRIFDDDSGVQASKGNGTGRSREHMISIQKIAAENRRLAKIARLEAELAAAKMVGSTTNA